MPTYKIQMYIRGVEEDAVSLRKHLAQLVSDEFDLTSAFGVQVELDRNQQTNSIGGQMVRQMIQSYEKNKEDNKC